ncbi:U-box domain [Carpediemonas membranifera]|uniref:U-box domain n=1 Tax=Carpediemonas membranifera TaxID=201153 RepID=A0A8J6AUT8_9EUKA|nr:U-box domain [Carpediemonas membranifera]|eukprot:KAG9392115.1 U-box domain [Carpediemonas membranifera]
MSASQEQLELLIPHNLYVHLLDPITYDLLEQDVLTTSEGVSYGTSSILEWIQTRPEGQCTDPYTRKPLGIEQLHNNVTLSSLIADLRGRPRSTEDEMGEEESPEEMARMIKDLSRRINVHMLRQKEAKMRIARHEPVIAEKDHQLDVLKKRAKVIAEQQKAATAEKHELSNQLIDLKHVATPGPVQSARAKAVEYRAKHKDTTASADLARLLTRLDSRARVEARLRMELRKSGGGVKLPPSSGKVTQLMLESRLG